MSTIIREVTIDADPDSCWEALRDFAALDKRLAPGFITESRLEGPETRVVTFFNGAVARERLVGVDDHARRLAYSVIESRFNMATTTRRRRSSTAARAAPASSGPPTCCRTSWPRPSRSSWKPGWRPSRRTWSETGLRPDRVPDPRAGRYKMRCRNVLPRNVTTCSGHNSRATSAATSLEGRGLVVARLSRGLGGGGVSPN